jgi:hypothetical protein
MINEFACKSGNEQGIIGETRRNSWPQVDFNPVRKQTTNMTDKKTKCNAFLYCTNTSHSIIKWQGYCMSLNIIFIRNILENPHIMNSSNHATYMKLFQHVFLYKKDNK